MPAPPADPPRRPRARRPAPRPPATWEDRLLGGVDQILGATMTPRPTTSRRRSPTEGGRKKPLFPTSWKRASAVEGVGMVLILLFVIVARPAPDASGDGALETFAGVAAGVTPDGAVVLTSGARVRLLGLTLPSDQDAPMVQSVAFEMLDRLVRGRRVEVEFDPVLPSDVQEGEPEAVAYVWVLDQAGDRRAMVNVALLARGLARPVTAVAFRYQTEFLGAAASAKSRGAGVWRAVEPEVGPLASPF